MKYKFLKKYALYQKDPKANRIYFIFWAITDNTKPAHLIAYTSGGYIKGLEILKDTLGINKKILLEKTWKDLEKTLSGGKIEIDGVLTEVIAIAPVGIIPEEYKGMIDWYYKKS